MNFLQRLTDSTLHRLYKFVLKRFFGKLLKNNLLLDQLDVKLRQGFVHLRDVELNEDALNDLIAEVPFTILRAVVGQLEILVNYTAILSESCTINLRNISIDLQIESLSNKNSYATDKLLKTPLNFNSDWKDEKFFGTINQQQQSSTNSSTHPQHKEVYPSEKKKETTDLSEGLEFVADWIEQILSRLKVNLTDLVICVYTNESTYIKLVFGSLSFFDETPEQPNTPRIQSDAELQDEQKAGIYQLLKSGALYKGLLFSNVSIELHDLKTNDVSSLMRNSNNKHNTNSIKNTVNVLPILVIDGKNSIHSKILTNFQNNFRPVIDSDIHIDHISLQMTPIQFSQVIDITQTLSKLFGSDTSQQLTDSIIFGTGFSSVLVPSALEFNEDEFFSNSDINKKDKVQEEIDFTQLELILQQYIVTQQKLKFFLQQVRDGASDSMVDEEYFDCKEPAKEDFGVESAISNSSKSNSARINFRVNVSQTDILLFCNSHKTSVSMIEFGISASKDQMKIQFDGTINRLSILQNEHYLLHFIHSENDTKLEPDVQIAFVFQQQVNNLSIQVQPAKINFDMGYMDELQEFLSAKEKSSQHQDLNKKNIFSKNHKETSQETKENQKQEEFKFLFHCFQIDACIFNSKNHSDVFCEELSNFISNLRRPFEHYQSTDNENYKQEEDDDDDDQRDKERMIRQFLKIQFILYDTKIWSNDYNSTNNERSQMNKIQSHQEEDSQHSRKLKNNKNNPDHMFSVNINSMKGFVILPESKTPFCTDNDGIYKSKSLQRFSILSVEKSKDSCQIQVYGSNVPLSLLSPTLSKSSNDSLSRILFNTWESNEEWDNSKQQAENRKKLKELAANIGSFIFCYFPKLSIDLTKSEFDILMKVIQKMPETKKNEMKDVSEKNQKEKMATQIKKKKPSNIVISLISPEMVFVVHEDPHLQLNDQSININHNNNTFETKNKININNSLQNPKDINKSIVTNSFILAFETLFLRLTFSDNELSEIILNSQDLSWFEVEHENNNESIQKNMNKIKCDCFARVSTDQTSKLVAQPLSTCKKIPVLYRTKWSSDIIERSEKPAVQIIYTVDNRRSTIVNNINMDFSGITLRYNPSSKWIIKLIDWFTESKIPQVISQVNTIKNINVHNSNNAHIQSQKAPVMSKIFITAYDGVIDYCSSGSDSPRGILSAGVIRISSNIIPTSSIKSFKISFNDITFYLVDRLHVPIEISGNSNFSSKDIESVYFPDDVVLFESKFVTNQVSLKRHPLESVSVQDYVEKFLFVQTITVDVIDVLIRQFQKVDEIKNLQPESEIEISIGTVYLYTCADTLCCLQNLLNQLWLIVGQPIPESEIVTPIHPVDQKVLFQLQNDFLSNPEIDGTTETEKKIEDNIKTKKIIFDPIFQSERNNHIIDSTLSATELRRKYAHQSQLPIIIENFYNLRPDQIEEPINQKNEEKIDPTESETIEEQGRWITPENVEENHQSSKFIEVDDDDDETKHDIFDSITEPLIASQIFFRYESANNRTPNAYPQDLTLEYKIKNMQKLDDRDEETQKMETFIYKEEYGSFSGLQKDNELKEINHNSKSKLKGNQKIENPLSNENDSKKNDKKEENSNVHPDGHLRMPLSTDKDVDYENAWNNSQAQMQEESATWFISSKKECFHIDDYFSSPDIDHDLSCLVGGQKFLISAEKSNSRPKMRLTLKKMNLRWKLFDGFDWPLPMKEDSNLHSDDHNSKNGEESKSFINSSNPQTDEYNDNNQNLENNHQTKNDDDDDDVNNINNNNDMKNQSQTKNLFNSLFSTAEGDICNENHDRKTMLLDALLENYEPNKMEPPIPLYRKIRQDFMNQETENRRHDDGIVIVNHRHQNRRTDRLLEIFLENTRVRVETFKSTKGNFLSSLFVVAIQDFHVMERFSAKQQKKAIYYWKSDILHPRECNSNMIHLQLAAFRSGDMPPEVADEYRLQLALLPLHIDISQSIIKFISDFTKYIEIVNGNGEIKEISINEPMTRNSYGIFFQKIDVKEVKVKIDYHPETVDLQAIQMGKYAELVNLFSLEGMELILTRVTFSSVSGATNVIDKILNSWVTEITMSQLHKCVAGVAALRPVVKIGSGIFKLVLVPFDEFQKDGKLIRGLRKGAAIGLREIATETLHTSHQISSYLSKKLGRIEVLGTNQYNHYYQQQQQQSHQSNRSQPKGVKEGLELAYDSLAKGLSSASKAIILIPLEEFQRSGSKGYLKSVIRGIPMAILRPIAGTTEAIALTLLGVRNAIDPNTRIEEEFKWKNS